MKQTTVLAWPAMLGLVLAMSACGSASDPDAAAPSQAAPSVQPSPATDAPTATSPPSTAPPTLPPQPSGVHGVTTQIQNWDTYATDPVVTDFKRANEAIGGSINADRLLPAMQAGLTQQGLKTYLPSLNQARKLDLHVPAIGKVRIASVTTTGARSMIVTCNWAPSVGYRYANGMTVPGTGTSGSADGRYWAKQKVGMRLIANRWRIHTVTFAGTCPGPKPS